MEITEHVRREIKGEFRKCVPDINSDAEAEAMAKEVRDARIERARSLKKGSRKKYDRRKY